MTDKKPVPPSLAEFAVEQLAATLGGTPSGRAEGGRVMPKYRIAHLKTVGIDRTHLAGLELALSLMIKHRLSSGGVHLNALASLEEAVEQAQAAPEAESVAVVGVRISTDGFGSYIADPAMGIGAAMPGEVREPLMTVAQHDRIMAASPQHDAELIELLREARRTFEMWKDVAPAISLCADIDAKLATLSAKP